MSSEILKENHHYLKACILYEVLQKKPIFDSYQNFCDTVGQDAINFPDFEFWFYRFYHGNRDFGYDRSADPEPKTIVDLPFESMTTIVGYLNPVERQQWKIVSNFEKLESCELTVRSLWNRFRAGAFAEALGEEIPVGPRRRIIHHRYQVRGSNKCLVFKVVDEVFRCRIRIVRVR
ncbi:hypothetical protein B9Z55_026935 [Caenorhabditis nigoni]|uniref:Mos1 transposase HTH domain-containing protein n=1 Tax=Caenorhabditis nigoni TaxID=1611254 RepID=A0A2G5SIP5_9PELO|nr:hypothetical protein B9Z55_026935 [Caenorhabditis nigoni]